MLDPRGSAFRRAFPSTDGFPRVLSPEYVAEQAQGRLVPTYQRDRIRRDAWAWVKLAWGMREGCNQPGKNDTDQMQE